MTQSILFVAALHHPEQLLQDRAALPPGQEPPLFPHSAVHHFYEKVLRARGWRLGVFWRNLPGLGPQEIARLRAEVHNRRLTPGRLAGALLRRLPPRANPDYRLRNRRLLEAARSFRPGWLWLVGDNTVIYPETLAAIKRETGCRILYSTGTSPIVFSHAIERQAARLYDLVLVNDYYHGIQWLELGAKQMICLPATACDPDFHHPYALSEDERARYTCDVAFIGTLLPDTLYGRRVQALEALHDFDLGIWSVHDVPASLRPHLRGYALGETMLRVLSAAKLTVNIHGDFMHYGGNMRLFEAAGAGVLQITDDLPGVREWFTPGQNIVTYRDPDDLRAQVAHYLAHPDEARRIAAAAREHVYTQHTYLQRVEALERHLQVLDSA